MGYEPPIHGSRTSHEKHPNIPILTDACARVQAQPEDSMNAEQPVSVDPELVSRNISFRNNVPQAGVNYEDSRESVLPLDEYRERAAPERAQPQADAPEQDTMSTATPERVLVATAAPEQRRPRTRSCTASLQSRVDTGVDPQDPQRPWTRSRTAALKLQAPVPVAPERVSVPWESRYILEMSADEAPEPQNDVNELRGIAPVHPQIASDLRESVPVHSQAASEPRGIAPVHPLAASDQQNCAPVHSDSLESQYFGLISGIPVPNILSGNETEEIQLVHSSAYGLDLSGPVQMQSVGPITVLTEELQHISNNFDGTNDVLDGKYIDSFGNERNSNSPKQLVQLFDRSVQETDSQKVDIHDYDLESESPESESDYVKAGLIPFKGYQEHVDRFQGFSADQLERFYEQHPFGGSLPTHPSVLPLCRQEGKHEKSPPVYVSSTEDELPAKVGKRHLSPPWQDTPSTRHVEKKTCRENVASAPEKGRHLPVLKEEHHDNSPREDKQQHPMDDDTIWVTVDILMERLQPIRENLETCQRNEDILFKHIVEIREWHDAEEKRHVFAMKMQESTMHEWRDIMQRDFEHYKTQSVDRIMGMLDINTWKHEFTQEILNMLTQGHEGAKNLSNNLEKSWTMLQEEQMELSKQFHDHDGRFRKLEQEFKQETEYVRFRLDQPSTGLSIPSVLYQQLREHMKEFQEKIDQRFLDHSAAFQTILDQFHAWCSDKFENMNANMVPDAVSRAGSELKTESHPLKCCKFCELLEERINNFVTQLSHLRERFEADCQLHTQLWHQQRVQNDTFKNAVCPKCTNHEEQFARLNDQLSSMQAAREKDMIMIQKCCQKLDSMDRLTQDQAKKIALLELRQMSTSTPVTAIPKPKPNITYVVPKVPERPIKMEDSEDTKVQPVSTQKDSIDRTDRSDVRKSYEIVPKDSMPMDKVQRGRQLSMQQHDGPNMSLGIANTHERLDDDDSDDASDEGPPRGPKTDSYSSRKLCDTVIGVPKWNGEGLSWKTFMKEWKAYWSFQRGLVGPKARRWTFISSLPDRWKDHMKANITDAGWTYKDIVDFLAYQNDITVPDWRKELEWRQHLPKGRTYMEFMHWWMSWRRLGSDCNLRDIDWSNQFNACMNHNSYFTKYLQEMIETEVCEEVPWTIDRKYAFIAGKLMIAYKTQETLKSVNTQDNMSRVITCFNCGLQGHVKSQCPKDSTQEKTGKGSICYKCGQQGHFAANCPKASKPSVGFRKEQAKSTPQQQVGGGSFQQKRYGQRSHSAPPGNFKKTNFSTRAQASQGATRPLTLNREELQRRKSQDLCLHCGKQGHYSKNCPVKNSVPDRKDASKQRTMKPTRGMPTPKHQGKVAFKNPAGKGKGHGKFQRQGRIREFDVHSDEDEDDFNTAFEEEEEHSSEEHAPDDA